MWSPTFLSAGERHLGVGLATPRDFAAIDIHCNSIRMQLHVGMGGMRETSHVSANHKLEGSERNKGQFENPW